MNRVLSLTLASLAVLATFGLGRPAQAQSHQGPATVGFPEGVTFDLLRDFLCVCQAEGAFKCPVEATLLSLLNAAEATTDMARRRQILMMAADCACKLSREIDYTGSPNPSASNYNPGYGRPYYTLAFIYPTWQDLANFHHNIPAQVYGRIICAAFHCLAMGDTGPCVIYMPQ